MISMTLIKSFLKIWGGILLGIGVVRSAIKLLQRINFMPGFMQRSIWKVFHFPASLVEKNSGQEILSELTFLRIVVNLEST